MPRKYSFAQKAAALVQLERNRGDVAYTASQMAISVRALRDWNGEIQAWLLPRTPPQRQNPGIIPAFKDDLETLAFIRTQIIDEMLRLSVSLKEDPGHATPYQRVIVLSQLMDKLMKLDQYLKPYEEVEIRYVLSDDVEPEDDEFWPEDAEDEPNGDGLRPL
jgi:hypothetical protein